MYLGEVPLWHSWGPSRPVSDNPRCFTLSIQVDLNLMHDNFWNKVGVTVGAQKTWFEPSTRIVPSGSFNVCRSGSNIIISRKVPWDTSEEMVFQWYQSIYCHAQRDDLQESVFIVFYGQKSVGFQLQFNFQLQYHKSHEFAQWIRKIAALAFLSNWMGQPTYLTRSLITKIFH